MNAQKQQSYHSYLLRLWEEESGGHPQWRATLESAQSGEIYRFASLETLLAFLRRQATAVAQIKEPGGSAGSEE